MEYGVWYSVHMHALVNCCYYCCVASVVDFLHITDHDEIFLLKYGSLYIHRKLTTQIHFYLHLFWSLVDLHICSGGLIVIMYRVSSVMARIEFVPDKWSNVYTHSVYKKMECFFSPIHLFRSFGRKP